MKITEKKIIVCCSTAISGGPELLHQLVHELRSIGRDAYIAYYPFEKSFDCPEPYKKYNAPQSPLFDDADTFVIIPEVSTWIIKRIKKAKVGVWWLSVDNYLHAKHQSKLRDLYSRYKSLLRWRVPLSRMRHLVHFSQSQYATDFLTAANITSIPLTDYLGEDHLINLDSKAPAIKENIVAYNPKKGQKQTKELMAANTDIKYIPIENMSSKQVAELLARAKIYIDFGHHPGKDRPPREAAMAGCCVITGLSGSAANSKDVAIPKIYKLNDKTSEYITDFRNLAEDIFSNYASHAREYEEYRNKIAQEPVIFKNQVKDIFN